MSDAGRIGLPRLALLDILVTLLVGAPRERLPSAQQAARL